MKRSAGLLLLVCVVIVVAIAARSRKNAPAGLSGATNDFGPSQGDVLTLKGFVGGEKMNFLNDPEVIKILADKYKIHLDFDRRGSLEMVEDKNAAQKDFLWPSSQVALELYKEKKLPLVQADIIFNSPIVLYSWDSVTQALIKLHIVQKAGASYYVVDFPKLIHLMTQGKDWKDIGLPQLYGKVIIYSTDPTLSNSGNMFSGLLANVLNNGQVVNDATIGAVLPTVKKFFDNQGFMEQSSDVIFQQFLNKGVGDKPIIVGYESQLIEYSLEQAQALSARKDALRTLYPHPTVWSSHPLIAVNENGKKLIAALEDSDVQNLAWRKHGFRSASGAFNDPKAINVAGIPENITNVIPMPAARIMDKIIRTLSGK